MSDKTAHGVAEVMRQTVTDGMIAAYLTASNRYWRETDKWRNGTALEATRVSLEAALAAAPVPPVERGEQEPESIDADYEHEHPGMRRMRLEFEAKYGAASKLMRAANAWFNLRTDFNAAWNRDQDTPVTEEDVGRAEQTMLATYGRPAPATSTVLATLRAEVEELPGWINPILHPPLVCISREQVLALIDKMGGEV